MFGVGHALFIVVRYKYTLVGPLPEVEMLTRDAGVVNPDAVVEGPDVHKPRVATWGMFPRPADISKAVIRLHPFFSFSDQSVAL